MSHQQRRVREIIPFRGRLSPGSHDLLLLISELQRNRRASHVPLEDIADPSSLLFNAQLNELGNRRLLAYAGKQSVRLTTRGWRFIDG